MNQVPTLFKFPALIVWEAADTGVPAASWVCWRQAVPPAAGKFCRRAGRGLCFANVTQKSRKDTGRRPWTRSSIKPSWKSMTVAAQIEAIAYMACCCNKSVLWMCVGLAAVALHSAEVSVKSRQASTNLNPKNPPEIEIKRPGLLTSEGNLLACSFGEEREEGLFLFLLILNICGTYIYRSMTPLRKCESCSD